MGYRMDGLLMCRGFWLNATAAFKTDRNESTSATREALSREERESCGESFKLPNLRHSLSLYHLALGRS